MTAILIPQVRRNLAPPRPGFAPERLERLVREAVAAHRLDLRGRCVVTEAATGAYVVTPVIAAVAGARRVIAVTRPTRYGNATEVRDATMRLAERFGVADLVEVVDRLTPEHLAEADVVTNSGHVRPIDERMVAQLAPGCVVPLMYESWGVEARPADVDTAALAARGIPFAGTNERHPHVDLLSCLGVMATWQLAQAGIGVHRSRIALVCDNDFAPYVGLGLTRAGAHVILRSNVLDLPQKAPFDAIVIAQTPTDGDVVDAIGAELVARCWPGAPVMQFWGDIDRGAFSAAGVGVWPPQEPPPGHMGVLPSDIGPEAIVRLQTGGLKVAEVLLKPGEDRTLDDLEHLDPHPDCEVRDVD